METHGTSENYDKGCRCKKCFRAHMSAIASRSVAARKKKYGAKGFSKLMSKAAVQSHPQNNPDAQRGEYVGGRPKNDVADSN